MDRFGKGNIFHSNKNRTAPVQRSRCFSSGNRLWNGSSNCNSKHSLLYRWMIAISSYSVPSTSGHQSLEHYAPYGMDRSIRTGVCHRENCSAVSARKRQRQIKQLTLKNSWASGQQVIRRRICPPDLSEGVWRKTCFSTKSPEHMYRGTWCGPAIRVRRMMFDSPHRHACTHALYRVRPFMLRTDGSGQVFGWRWGRVGRDETEIFVFNCDWHHRARDGKWFMSWLLCPRNICCYMPNWCCFV